EQRPHERIEADTGADPYPPLVEVRRQDGVEAGGVDDHAPGTLGRVAVRSTEATGDDVMPPGLDGRHEVVDLVGMAEPGHLRRARCRLTPSAQNTSHCRERRQ